MPRPFSGSPKMAGFSSIGSQYPLILASASPRRKRLLTQVGLPYRSVPSRVTEKSTGKGDARDPGLTTRFLSEQKARQVHPRTGGSWILGADTIVVIGDEILGKPLHREDARHMLSLLSGKEHDVITGFCLLDPLGRPAHSEAVTTRVRVKNLTEAEIEGYLNTGEPFGKAGSYAIQGIGAFMVEGISGSFTNVVGLPLHAVIRALVSKGALKEFPLPPPPASAAE
jgi:septum formation protein